MKIKHFILMAVVALIAIACGNMDNPLEVINNSDNNQDPTIVDTTTPIVTSIGIKDVNGNSLPSLSITIPIMGKSSPFSARLVPITSTTSLTMRKLT